MHWRESRLQMEQEIEEELVKQRWQERHPICSWSIWKIREYARKEAEDRCRRAIRLHNDQSDERKRRRGEAT